ncbi:hypothetical protein ALC56_08421 [Trachymyrmex septentrionalis]|uniref:Uncharacterized protein n=1 Tax=Trachymyrmex septentrionalis TaxID=34720 RepID=A0A195F8C3_9HYME|nr:hypothetical protein ALC56_08421 [Trachymyrmex septentrionalis]
MKFLSVGIDVPDVAHPVYSTDNTTRLQHDPYPVISNAKRNVELRNLRSENRCKELMSRSLIGKRTSLPKHCEALVTATRARDVFITLQKRESSSFAETNDRMRSASGLERVACVSKDGNLGSGHPLSPLARLPGPTGHPDRASHAAEHSVLGRLMVRPGWRTLAVAHTHADWIGHCTPCSSASEQGNCVHSQSAVNREIFGQSGSSFERVLSSRFDTAGGSYGYLVPDCAVETIRGPYFERERIIWVTSLAQWLIVEYQSVKFN